MHLDALVLPYPLDSVDYFGWCVKSMLDRPNPAISGLINSGVVE